MELAIEREGYSVAKWLNERGIAAFVLKYRLAPTAADSRQAALQLEKWAQESLVPAVLSSRDPDYTEGQHISMTAAIEDGVEAIHYLRARAARWNLSPHRIGFMGFSAGAMTAVGVALRADAADRPDIVVPVYGAIPLGGGTPAVAPPAFIVAAADDTFSSNSLAIYNLWRAHAGAAELHVLESGGHGFGMLHQGKSSDYWPEQFDHWLTAHGFETHGLQAARRTPADTTAE
jgi:acetyl esterase/lipase